MAAAAPIFMIMATSMQAVSSMQQANAASNAASFNASQSRINADIATKQAAQDEQSFRMMNQKQIGQSRTAYGASGVGLEGSPLELLSSNAALMELDALRIRQGGANKAQGYYSDAQLNDMKSSSASTGGYISASAQLLGGAAHGYDKGYF